MQSDKLETGKLEVLLYITVILMFLRIVSYYTHGTQHIYIFTYLLTLCSIIDIYIFVYIY